MLLKKEPTEDCVFRTEQGERDRKKKNQHRNTNELKNAKQ